MKWYTQQIKNICEMIIFSNFFQVVSYIERKIISWKQKLNYKLFIIKEKYDIINFSNNFEVCWSNFNSNYKKKIFPILSHFIYFFRESQCLHSLLSKQKIILRSLHFPPLLHPSKLYWLSNNPSTLVNNRSDQINKKIVLDY